MEKKITMLTYIEETPNQLEYNNKHRKEITEQLVQHYLQRNCKTLWIVACGSSYNGTQCALSFMRKYLDCHIKVVTPNTFIYDDHRLDKEDIVIVVSQSGCSTNAIEALKFVKQKGLLTIGLTGNLNSDFKDYTDVLVDYHVGEETVGYVTKGVTTLAQFFMMFSLEVALHKQIINEDTYNNVVEEMKECPLRHIEVQRRTWEFYNHHQKELKTMHVCYCTGFKQGYGIAQEAALKIGETVKVPSFAYEAEEYIHGPNLQLTPTYTVFHVDDMLEGSKRVIDVYHASRAVTEHAFIVTNDDSVDDEHALRLPFDIREPLLMPLYVLPFFQIIAFKLTDDLDKWAKHPLIEDFKKKAVSKTENIMKVMKNY